METLHTSSKSISLGVIALMNTTNCPACNEVIQFIKEKIDHKESFMLAVTFENDTVHYHAIVSPVQVEKLNNEFKILT
jgi:hypothetical protein